MRTNLKRTHTTSLTDDELILLDVMFSGGAPFRMLRQSVFTDQWNCPPHNLDDCQLGDTLDRFCSTGMLESDLVSFRDARQMYYYMTPHGGSSWESERTPIWDRYAMDTCWSLEGWAEKEIVFILAVSAGIRDDFWQVGRDVGMWQGNVRRACLGGEGGSTEGGLKPPASFTTETSSVGSKGLDAAALSTSACSPPRQARRGSMTQL
jgi:hypothetical protein